jgi:hypothetical protein
LEALLRHPKQLHALQEDPTLIDNAVDEIIRWVTPVRHFLRYAQEDYQLGPTLIRAGERELKERSTWILPARSFLRKLHAGEVLTTA